MLIFVPSNKTNNNSALDSTVKSVNMKFLFNINGKSHEVELSQGETKRIEYQKGYFANVTINLITKEPTKTNTGRAFLRVEFDNGNTWDSNEAIIARIKNEIL